MTVAELIEKLSQIEDQNTRVVTRGYEGGYDDVNHDFREIDMALNVNTEWYFGKHDKVDNVYHEDREKYQIVKAIIL